MNKFFNKTKELSDAAMFSLLFFCSFELAGSDYQFQEYVGNDKIMTMCSELYKKIEADKFVPDLLIGLARGGLVPLGHLAGENCFNQRNVMSISVQSYNYNKQGELVFNHVIDLETIKKNKHILLVDDLVDTGKTMIAVKEKIEKSLASDAAIKLATLFYKESSKIKPDYYVETTDKWIVFPWEK